MNSSGIPFNKKTNKNNENNLLEEIILKNYRQDIIQEKTQKQIDDITKILDKLMSYNKFHSKNMIKIEKTLSAMINEQKNRIQRLRGNLDFKPVPFIPPLKTDKIKKEDKDEEKEIKDSDSDNDVIISVIPQQNGLTSMPLSGAGGLSKLFESIFGGNTKKEKVVENESDSESDYSNYSSSDEFEDLGINNGRNEIDLDGLIKLGNLYIELKEEENKKEEETVKIKPKRKLPSPKINHEGIQKLIMKNKIPVISSEIKEDKKEIKKKEKYYTINNKKYSINLESLHKLSVPLKKLRSLIGLKTIKDSIVDMILYYLQHFEHSNKNMLHTIIEGAPGVGKTEVGRIIGEIYSALGVIPSNKFKVVKRTDLIGEYVGHTAHKTQKAIDEADGGVLFIDEAYSLGSSDKKDSFSEECINIINQNLSEKRKKLIVIIAGYKDELEKSFFSYNPGLRRRFPFKYTIDGYTSEELRDIFIKKVDDNKWKFHENLDKQNLFLFFKENMEQFPHYGGDIENLLLAIKFSHSRRIFNKHPKFRRIIINDDLKKGFERFLLHKKKKDAEFLSYYS